MTAAPKARTLILNQCQAEAIYSAMCALNNVNMQITSEERTLTGKLTVTENAWGRIVVTDERDGARLFEAHVDQSAFATAYGLQQG